MKRREDVLLRSGLPVLVLIDAPEGERGRKGGKLWEKDTTDYL